MRITITGGGNIGTQFAVHCAEKGHEVIIMTSAPELYDGHLSIVDENGNVTHEGDIEFATADPKTAYENAHMVFVTVPSMMMAKVADDIYRYADEDTVIYAVPGNGGSECAFLKCIERGNFFCGIERVPAIARLVEKGKTVKSVGYRDELHVAAIPRREAMMCAAVTESIFGIRTTAVPCYLNLTMTPSNPILHTSRLRTLFGDWHEGVVYDSLPLFYEGWDNASSALLFELDEEVQSICRALPEFSLSFVKSLREHYESPTIEMMTQKLSSIPAFRGIKTPCVRVGDGFIPDLNSRYFTADFSYGLSIIRQIGRIAGVDTPAIDDTLAWYDTIKVNKQEFSFKDYDIETKADLKYLYLM